MSKKTKQYTGCIGSIEKARNFARESFVYGIREKSDYSEISPRAYDEATRQMGDWFQECLQTRIVKVRNKVKYLSLDCRDYSINPLYKIWKARSFTSNEIVFFFAVLEILSEKESVSIGDLYTKYDLIHRTGGFSQSMAQNWLRNKGCPSEMIVKMERGKYCLAESSDISRINDSLLYFSEIAPSGVIGSFILDKQTEIRSPFRFKQHYIGQAFDCEIICNVLFAIKNKRQLNFSYNPKGKGEQHICASPVKVYSSTQSGRQYLITWDENEKRFINYRLDRIKSIDVSETKQSNIETIRKHFKEAQKHAWGVSFGDGELTHVEMLVKVEDNEYYIVKRLKREKRCGRVSLLDGQEGIYKFEADVFDAHEMFPWLRTFICRIIDLKFSDKDLEQKFWDSIQEMYKIYTIENS